MLGAVGGRNLISGDEEATSRCADRIASDKSEDGFVGAGNEGGDIGRADNFLASDGVGVADRIVIDVDKVAGFEAFEARENEFVRV